jgi:hypothetical protein
MAEPIRYEPAGVAVDLADEEEAIALAEMIARKLNRTVIVTDGSGKKICVKPLPRKLDS